MMDGAATTTTTDTNKKDALKKGDRVKVVAGKYKANRHGTFLRYAGSSSADVRIDYDEACERCLRLTSIERVTKEDTSRETITLSREDYFSIVEDIEAIPLTTDNLDTRLQNLVSKMEKLATVDDLKRFGRRKSKQHK